jgi:hypothetical protein
MKRTSKYTSNGKNKAKQKKKRFEQLHPEMCSQFELEKFTDPIEWLREANKCLQNNQEIGLTLVPKPYINQYRSNFDEIINKKETRIIKNSAIIAKLEKQVFCGNTVQSYICGLNTCERVKFNLGTSYSFIIILYYIYIILYN